MNIYQMTNRFSIFVVLSFFIVLSVITACSQKNESVLVDVGVANAAATPTPTPLSEPLLPKPTGFVNDFAGALDTDTEAAIEKDLVKLQNDAKIDFAIALVKTTNDQDIFDYSLQVAKEWKIGSENGGLLLLVAIDDRKWRIQTNRKLEKLLTDSEAKKIGDLLVPDFKEQNYSLGIKKCVDSMIKALSDKVKNNIVKRDPG